MCTFSRTKRYNWRKHACSLCIAILSITAKRESRGGRGPWLRGSRGGRGSEPSTPWDLSEVDSCVEVCLVGEGVQLLCLSYYNYHFFSCSLRSAEFYKHITGIHTSKFSVHYETVILFPYPNHEKDPTSQPLFYYFKGHFLLFCLELHDLKPFKPKIFWGRTPPPPRHIYNLQYQNYHVIRVFVQRGLQLYKRPFLTDN